MTVCRRATEEALRALAEDFPAVDRADLEARLKESPGTDSYTLDGPR